MRSLLPAAILLVLAACGRGEDQAAPPLEPAPPPPAPTAADFARPINALGNEPFWSLKIRPEGLTFSAPDRSDLEAANPGPDVSGNEAVWVGDAAGQPVRATLRAEVCQDGMSGLHYPFLAEVEVDGQTLSGCAAYADEMPREG